MITVIALLQVLALALPALGGLVWTILQITAYFARKGNHEHILGIVQEIEDILTILHISEAPPTEDDIKAILERTHKLY